METVNAIYLEGIREGRACLEKYGTHDISIQDRIDNLRSTMRGFPASTPVGQLLRGELDFWLNQAKRAI